MTEDEQITLGDYCEGLLYQEHFNTISQHFDRQCFEHFLAATSISERETVHAQMSGFRDFLSHLKAYVDTRDRLLVNAQALSDNSDAHIEGID